MTVNLNKFQKDIDLWFESDECKEYFRILEIKQKIRIERFLRFGEWIKNNDFDSLMYRIILKHDDDYREKYYHNGNEPRPNNILEFIIDYAVCYGIEANPKELKLTESNYIIEFNGYFFQKIHLNNKTNIYNKKDLRLLLQI